MKSLSPSLRRALARVSDTWETAAALHVSERSLWALERRALVEAFQAPAMSYISRDKHGWSGGERDARFLWRRLRPADPGPDQPPRSTDSG